MGIVIDVQTGEITEQEYVPDVEYLKQAAIARIKLEAGSEILERYPTYRQLNIANRIDATDADFAEMVAFINEVRGRCNAAEAALDGGAQ